VAAAIIEAQAARGVLGVAEIEARLPQFRGRVGRFVGAGPDEIAFLRNTGDGANVVARGLDWRPGDEVVLSDNEFGANAYPWLALRELGVRIRFVHAPEIRLTPDALRATMSDRTRAVAVSWVSFADGYRHDVAGLARVAHERGALLCVDAMQGLGAFGLDVKADGIDALYCGGAKWLLSPQGISFLYVDRALHERIVPRWRGWRDVADIWNFLDYDQPLAPTGARYEGGTPNFLGVAALSTSMDVLDEAGRSRIADHVLMLTDRLVAGLRALGAEVDSPRGPGASSGIVTFRVPGRDPVEVGRALRDEGIVTTYRAVGIRVSPHGYNTTEEIDRLLAALQARAPAR
jgi:cysteine desulfurase / selenocysteine lyase